jgi:uncharacterized protein (TIGR03382 family)
MRTCLFIVLLGVVAHSAPAWSQDLPDSGLPDGSVGEGSAEGMSEENDPQGGPCLTSKDCSQSFACVSQRCVPIKPKTVGCASMPGTIPLTLVALGALGTLLRRRRQ